VCFTIFKHRTLFHSENFGALPFTRFPDFEKNFSVFLRVPIIHATFATGTQQIDSNSQTATLALVGFAIPISCLASQRSLNCLLITLLRFTAQANPNPNHIVNHDATNSPTNQLAVSPVMD